MIASEFRATCGVVQGRGGRIQSSYEGGCGRGGTTEIVPPKKALAKQRRPSHASMSTVAIPQPPLPHAIRYGASRNAPNIPTPPRPAARQHHRSHDVADDREMTDARRKGGGSSKSPQISARSLVLRQGNVPPGGWGPPRAVRPSSCRFCSCLDCDDDDAVSMEEDLRKSPEECGVPVKSGPRDGFGRWFPPLAFGMRPPRADGHAWAGPDRPRRSQKGGKGSAHVQSQ